MSDSLIIGTIDDSSSSSVLPPVKDKDKEPKGSSFDELDSSVSHDLGPTSNLGPIPFDDAGKKKTHSVTGLPIKNRTDADAGRPESPLMRISQTGKAAAAPASGLNPKVPSMTGRAAIPAGPDTQSKVIMARKAAKLEHVAAQAAQPAKIQHKPRSEAEIVFYICVIVVFLALGAGAIWLGVHADWVYWYFGSHGAAAAATPVPTP